MSKIKVKKLLPNNNIAITMFQSIIQYIVNNKYSKKKGELNRAYSSISNFFINIINVKLDDISSIYDNSLFMNYNKYYTGINKLFNLKKEKFPENVVWKKESTIIDNNNVYTFLYVVNGKLKKVDIMNYKNKNIISKSHISDNEIYNILDNEPYFIFVLLELYKYNKTINILLSFVQNRQLIIFNPRLFEYKGGSFKKCIVCMNRINNGFVCTHSFCITSLNTYIQNNIQEILLNLITFMIPDIARIILQYVSLFTFDNNDELKHFWKIMSRLYLQ
jgi:hypothetical protein